MNKELLTRWVEALRSGEYKQGTGLLCDRDIESSDVKYCCLGVLQHIEPSIKVHGLHPEELLDNISFFEHTGIDSDQRNLAEMNDNGVEFPEIADYIEKEYIKGGE